MHRRLLLLAAATTAFRAVPRRRALVTPPCGLFDAFASAFKNEDYSRADRRVRARHVLVADRDTAISLRDEIGSGASFAEVARRESTCASASSGGDLGSFGPGKMVAEFDAALFPDFDEPPPPGSLVGPVQTQFGYHLILVVDREGNTDQVEELLARND